MKASVIAPVAIYFVRRAVKLFVFGPCIPQRCYLHNAIAGRNFFGYGVHLPVVLFRTDGKKHK